MHIQLLAHTIWFERNIISSVSEGVLERVRRANEENIVRTAASKLLFVHKSRNFLETKMQHHI